MEEGTEARRHEGHVMEGQVMPEDLAWRRRPKMAPVFALWVPDGGADGLGSWMTDVACDDDASLVVAFEIKYVSGRSIARPLKGSAGMDFNRLKFGDGATRTLGVADLNRGGVAFCAAMDAAVRAGKGRGEALREAAAAHPDAHRAYVACFQEAAAWRYRHGHGPKLALAQACERIVLATGVPLEVARMLVAKHQPEIVAAAGAQDWAANEREGGLCVQVVPLVPVELEGVAREELAAKLEHAEAVAEVWRGMRPGHSGNGMRRELVRALDALIGWESGARSAPPIPAPPHPLTPSGTAEPTA